ncbi:zinc-binding dehydrogenase [Amaricoccus sp.]|uniref:zinc-binding dehydrogenase n=1 Tax=Amaricoccus sp. TaxID=1872485 RepID=UPI001B6F6A7A|nr:zinc-binding dehydrogenase [Amaricoccus sp.]MBP7002745.1 zinc-binding dehydrogenase [Amaricoccus sp.]
MTSETCLAWSWHERGDPSGLRLCEPPLPAPGPGEVLLRNLAIGLNPVDWKMIEWGPAAWGPGRIPGVDGCGVVAAAGEGLRLPVGRRFAYHQSLGRDGSFASHTLVPADCLLPVPAEIDDIAAAALPCPGLTAWQALAKLPGDGGRDVLVSGAGGAVGLILTQLALRAGWRVWATASPAHHAGLMALGVCGAFDYRAADWRERLAAALGPRRLHAAFDTVSGAHARSLAPLLGYNGHLVCIQDRQEEAPLPAFSTAISLHEVALNSAHLHATAEDWLAWRRAGRTLFELLAGGELRLPEIRTETFERLPDALAGLRTSGGPFKRVVTAPGGRARAGS